MKRWEKVGFKGWQQRPLSANIADGSLHLSSGRILVLLTGRVQRGHSVPACTCAPISPPVWCHMLVCQTTGSLFFFLPVASVHWPHSVRPAKTKSFWAFWRWPFGRSSKKILLALKWWMRASARGVPLENGTKGEEYSGVYYILADYTCLSVLSVFILSFFLLFFISINTFAVSHERLMNQWLSKDSTLFNIRPGDLRELLESAVAMRLCEMGLEHSSVLWKVNLYFNTSCTRTEMLLSPLSQTPFKVGSVKTQSPELASV